LEGVRLSFQLGVVYQQVQAGQNVASYNALVDQYNAWVRQYFGTDPNMIMSKIETNMNLTGKKPFKNDSDLSAFGKQEVHDSEAKSNVRAMEWDQKDQTLKDFLGD